MPHIDTCLREIDQVHMRRLANNSTAAIQTVHRAIDSWGSRRLQSDRNAAKKVVNQLARDCPIPDGFTFTAIQMWSFAYLFPSEEDILDCVLQFLALCKRLKIQFSDYSQLDRTVTAVREAIEVLFEISREGSEFHGKSLPRFATNAHVISFMRCVLELFFQAVEARENSIDSTERRRQALWSVGDAFTLGRRYVGPYAGDDVVDVKALKSGNVLQIPKNIWIIAITYIRAVGDGLQEDEIQKVLSEESGEVLVGLLVAVIRGHNSIEQVRAAISNDTYLDLIAHYLEVERTG